MNDDLASIKELFRQTKKHFEEHVDSQYETLQREFQLKIDTRDQGLQTKAVRVDRMLKEKIERETDNQRQLEE